jgi:hypothetical protein
VGPFKGVVLKGMDFLSSNPKMNFLLGGRGMGSFTTRFVEKGIINYIRKCSLPL